METVVNSRGKQWSVPYRDAVQICEATSVVAVTSANEFERSAFCTLQCGESPSCHGTRYWFHGLRRVIFRVARLIPLF